MKEFLRHTSKRLAYDGWALLMPGAAVPIKWTTCTARDEARELRDSRPDLFERSAKIVKVKISVEAIGHEAKDV